MTMASASGKVTTMILLVLGAEGDQRAALQWAVAEAARRAPCSVSVAAVGPPEGLLSVAPREPLIAWDPPTAAPPPVPRWTRDRTDQRDARHHAVQQRLDRLVAATAVPDGASVTTEVLDHAQHRAAVVRRAAAADLVVLDPREARLAHDVLQEAGVPVVLVPATPEVAQA